MGLVDEAAGGRDLGDAQAIVVEQADGAFHAATAQVGARRTAVAAAERARQVDRMHVDLACQFRQRRRTPPLVGEDFARAFQPRRAFLGFALHQVCGGIQQFLEAAFHRQR